MTDARVHDLKFLYLLKLEANSRLFSARLQLILEIREVDAAPCVVRDHDVGQRDFPCDKGHVGQNTEKGYPRRVEGPVSNVRLKQRGDQVQD
jgi:hypothetical protein